MTYVPIYTVELSTLVVKIQVVDNVNNDQS